PSATRQFSGQRALARADLYDEVALRRRDQIDDGPGDAGVAQEVLPEGAAPTVHVLTVLHPHLVAFAPTSSGIRVEQIGCREGCPCSERSSSPPTSPSPRTRRVESRSSSRGVSVQSSRSFTSKSRCLHTPSPKVHCRTSRGSKRKFEAGPSASSSNRRRKPE